MNKVFKRSSDNLDFLIAICLVSRPESINGMARTIKSHVKSWEKAELIPPVPVSPGFSRERVKEFIERYSDEEN